MKSICILCLKKTVAKKCAEAKLFIELLDVLLLNPWWNISQTPMLCYSCSMKIAKAFGFKANCTYTEDLLAPHIKNISKSDLRSAYLRMKKCEVESQSSREFYNICCLCINLINGSFTFLLDLLKDHRFQDKFKKYIPEVGLKNIEDPVICQQCNDNLRNFIEFVSSCMATSNVIKQFREKRKIKDGTEIDLREVLEEVVQDNVSQNTIKEDIVESDNEIGSILPSKDDCDRKSEEIEVESDHLTSDSEQSIDRISKNSNNHTSVKQTGNEAKEMKDDGDSDTSQEGKKSFKCKYCDFKTAVKTRIGKHVRRKHSDIHDVSKYSCDKCDYQTTDRYYLTRHSLRHKDTSEVEIYRCNKCTYETRYKDHLRGHCLTHLSKEELTIYRCDRCSFTTKFKGGLTQHRKTHEDLSSVETFKCGIGTCTYRTLEKSYLNKHIKRHGKPPEMETLHCLKCDYQTKYKKHMRDHVLVHAGKYKILNCKLCGFKTKLKDNLQTHMLRKHT